MTLSELLERAKTGLVDAAFAGQIADAALNEGREDIALPVLTRAAERVSLDPIVWQWKGLLHRALDEREHAIPAFERSAALAPQNARIAHGHARVVFEAGLLAIDLFEKAIRLAPSDGDAILGRAAAQLAVGDGARASNELSTIVAANPNWIAGHNDLSQLQWVMGDTSGFLSSLEESIALVPGNAVLWQALLEKQISAGRYDEALATVARARVALGDQVFLTANEAVAHSEAGSVALADHAFRRLGAPRDVSHALSLVRHCLRNGRVGDALPIVERWLATADANVIWPYAAIAWRLSGDPRWEWLEGDRRLVSVSDISTDLPELNRLADFLRRLHKARNQHLDQSVRGGTQTDGALFSRIEPEIKQVRAAIVAAVAAHIAQLPPPDPTHPTLRQRRDRMTRFAGSWSVRLASSGFHGNHVHPMGWLSSALYVALPDSTGSGDCNDGGLTLGVPQAELGLDLPSFRRIEQKPGTLILFPSTMWHGTVPFSEGERLTTAFDVAHQNFASIPA